MLKAMNKIGVAALVLLLCVAGRARAQDLDHSPSFAFGNPVVISHTPLSEQLGVFTDTTVRVNFSRAMRCHSINLKSFKLTGPNQQLIAGTIACEGSVAIFTPSNLLAINTKYAVRIKGSAKGENGKNLNGGLHYDFTTGLGVRPPATPTPTPSPTATATPTPTATSTATATPTA